ncbi:hypothetical protein ACLRE7_00830 [Mycoplasmopsis meleagridis]
MKVSKIFWFSKLSFVPLIRLNNAILLFIFSNDWLNELLLFWLFK